jgi:uncharacterized protein YciI
MKNISLLVIFLVVLNISSYCQKDSAIKKTEPNIKQFWLVVLKTGPKDKEITDTAERNKFFAGHFANMNRLHSEGILKAAGPFGKNDFTWRGLFILDCKTKEDAESYAKTDPAVAAGIFIIDIVPWWSEATGSFVSGKPRRNKKRR